MKLERAAASGDWANLLPELLQLIANKLNNICDYIRFHCVCTSWRGTESPHRRLPWLVVTSLGDFLPIFNPADCRFYNIPLPEEVGGNIVYGSTHGWLVMVSPDGRPRTEVTLYNPITRDSFLLPPLPEDSTYTKVHLCCNPTTAYPRQLLLAIAGGNVSLLIYRRGDAYWTKIEKPPEFSYFNDIAYLEEKAKLYAMDTDGKLALLFLATSTMLPIICDPSKEVQCLADVGYLVKSGGDLLLVARQTFRSNIARDAFKLHRSKKGYFEWARTTSIGDRTLFVTRTDFLSAVVCDEDLIDARANQIYHFNDWRRKRTREDFWKSYKRIDATILVRDLIAGSSSDTEECFSRDTEERSFSVRTRKFEEKTRYTGEFTWMIPSMS